MFAVNSKRRGRAKPYKTDHSILDTKDSQTDGAFKCTDNK
jgi:hypothetical protein